MEVKSAFSNAVAGITRGMRDLNDNASKVAHAATTEGQSDVVKPLVDSRLNQRQVEANAKVISMVDEALGSLIDEKA